MELKTCHLMTVAAALLATALSSPARSEAPHAEIDLFGGASSNGDRVTTSVLRSFGEVANNWRFFVEGDAAAHGGPDSDTFATTYPYAHRLSLLETYVEHSNSTGAGNLNVRLGRLRPPFGISSESDQGYIGFTRPPLMRYDDNDALSSLWLDSGVDVTFGPPRLQVEAAVGSPAEEDGRPHGSLDSVVRLQGYHGALILGASHFTTHPDEAEDGATGSSDFTGLDARWMSGGIQLRAEWITGHPFRGGHIRGGYLDAIIHRPGMDRLTALLRFDSMAINTTGDNHQPSRIILGGKVRVVQPVTLQVNLVQPIDGRPRALDFALLITRRFI